MQALFQLDVQGDELLPRLNAEFFRENSNDDFVRSLSYQWSKGAWDHRAKLDELIGAAIIRWEFSRLSPVDKSILRLAVYQLKYCQDIPPKVVINEAIEMAKKFSTDKSPGFVNGVLDAVLKKI